ncbi:MAG: hypothetical protein Q9227_005857 [Pyrenula ochraceoflavens]
MTLCSVCSKIPFKNLFCSSKKPRQYLIGDYDHVANNRLHCIFCAFLGDTFELAFDKQQQHLALQSKGKRKVRFGFQILRQARSSLNEREEPWFERAGISINAPSGPVLWLQFFGVKKSRVELQPPLVCVTYIPAEHEEEDVKGIVPRHRKFDEASTGRVNYDLVKRWIQTTNAKLRLIDVSHRRIRFVDGDVPYAALSYVWGESHREQYGRFWDNVAPGAEDVELPADLPQTSQDAITFTGNMGCSHLWIDSMCIHQRDPQEQKSQIATMDLVYECAYFTIAAMDGQSAHTGLHGVSKPFQKIAQPQVILPCGKFVATYIHHTWHHQGTLPWETRAWTLQELLLSRRIIFFNEYHVTMRCQSEYFSDLFEFDDKFKRPIFDQSDMYYWENGFAVRLHDLVWSFLQYDNLLSNYTRRHLSYQGDAVPACQGALNQITRNTGVSFLQGLPRGDLHLALLWKPHHNASLVRRHGFPTWSWTGWIGCIEHHYCLAELALYQRDGVAQKPKSRPGRKRKRSVSPNQESMIALDEAFIMEQGESELRVSSELAQVTVKKVRKMGRKTKVFHFDSEQAREAMGDQWVLLSREGVPISNDVGEVARFETVDYSFQVGPAISDQLEQSHRKCTLLFIKYFPYLRDHGWRERGWKEDFQWLFDLVGCLVVVKIDRDRSLDYYERVGFVFLKLEDWMAFQRETKVVNLF